MKFRRTDDPDVNFMDADPVWLWAYGVAEFHIDIKDRKFLLTPVGRDGSSEGPTVDVTEAADEPARPSDLALRPHRRA